MSVVSDYEKHSVLYFGDGNVCLAASKLNLTAASNSSSEAASPGQEAEKPAGPAGTLFRVHQTVLSLHSPIFSDTFALPNPKGASETYEGVPLVQMPDDADDLESLLKAFYFGYELPYPRLNPNTPDAVRNTLVMANKYQVDFIRKIIVDRLESDWPQSVLAWERLESEIFTMGDQEEALEYVGPSLTLDDALPEPATAIRLARDCNIPSILPAAFYHLSRLFLSDDWHIVRGLSQSEIFFPFAYPRFRSVRWSLLSGEEMRCLPTGQAALRAYAIGRAKRILTIDVCEDMENHCKIDDDYLRQLAHKINLCSDPKTDILAALRAFSKEVDETHFCYDCRDALKSALSTQAIWENLPKFFALN